VEDGLFGEDLTPFAEQDDIPAPRSFTPPDIPLDLQATLARFEGDRDFMLEMCRDFREHLPARIDEFNTALRDGDVNRLCRHAHTLKGISLTFEAAFLAELAAEVEELCRRDKLAETTLLVRQIEIEAVRVQGYLRTQNI
jgi:HPt (histidine-containing phosphotransfer) domain-containing protein